VPAPLGNHGGLPLQQNGKANWFHANLSSEQSEGFRPQSRFFGPAAKWRHC
jgi:hypothetical protein